MREIKFRAWIPIEKRMAVVTDIDFEIGIVAVEEVGLEQYNFLADSNVVLEQYTGLKDVKGVEIYEGDILSYNERDIYTGNYHKRPLVVRFLDDSAMFDASGLLLWKVSLRSEVVGNIHENPELLEG